MKRRGFDIETDGLLHELTRIWVLCIGDPETGQVTRYTDYDPDYPSLAEGLAELESCDELFGHNIIGFDIPAILKVTGINLDNGSLRILDTLVMGRLKDPERTAGHSLESYGLQFGVEKGSHTDWSCYSEDMATYCEQDVRVSIRVFEVVSVVLTWGGSADLEHHVARIIELQMSNGFLLDIRAATELAAALQEESSGYAAELQEVFPPIYISAGEFTPKRDNARMGYVAGVVFTKLKEQVFNPGSTDQVARRLKRRYGWNAPLTDKGNVKVDEAVLKKLDFVEVPLLLKFTRANKLFTQVAGPKKKNGTGGGWLHHADDNGRVHGYVNPNGAVTGRMTHSRPNSANIDKDARMRALWLPGHGKVLVGCDAEGLELRMLAHYLYPLDGGKFACALLEGDKTKGTDAHSLNRDIAELATRDGAKTLIYGLIYGAGDVKVGQIWVSDWQASGKPKDEWPVFAFGQHKTGKLLPLKKIGAIIRDRLEKGIDGFGKLVKGVKAKAKLRKWLKGLDGRRTWVRSDHAALNTLLQGGGAIVMKKALVILHERLTARWTHGVDFGYCANVHDEWQIEARPEIAAEIGEMGKQAITDAGIALNVLCRLDGAYDIGKNWHETH